MQNKNEGDKLIPTNTARIKMEKPEYPAKAAMGAEPDGQGVL